MPDAIMPVKFTVTVMKFSSRLIQNDYNQRNRLFEENLFMYSAHYQITNAVDFHAHS